MEQLVDTATAVPPSLGASLALGLTWVFSIVFAFVSLGFLFRPQAD